MIVISHASKNRETVLRFKDLLETISDEIDAFCSSETGSIGIGQNFPNKIIKELGSCDAFVAIISNEYYESRYCMIELGVAYSYFYSKFGDSDEDFIFPFALPPVKKSNALAGTPLAFIQTADLNDIDDLRTFCENLKKERSVGIKSGLSKRLREFVYELTGEVLGKQDILKSARIGAYFDDSIDFYKKSDIIRKNVSADSIQVNFNLNPYEKDDARVPNFFSVVLEYADGINLSKYLDYKPDATMRFALSNFTNSLKRIYVEFKHSDNIRVLETFELTVRHGDNEFDIPLVGMQSKALENITEICFVVHPDDTVETEGMFEINSIRIE